MLIGVDCAHLVEEGRTGTENYLYNILKNLAEADKENNYVLYFKVEPSAVFWNDLCGQRKTWSYRVISSRISWTQVGLAKATFLDCPDRLLCTWHTVPIIHCARTKLVAVIHDFSYPMLKSYPLYICLLLSYRLIGVSDYTYRGIVARVPWKKSSIFKQYEGVDLVKYRKSEAAVSFNTRYFLSVGTLTARKNLENMILAFCRIIKEGKYGDINYVIVGKCAKDYESIYEFAQRTGYGDKIRFVGRLEDSEVIQLYSNALALLYVSIDEGFGLPILEALACGCSVITSNVSSMKEIGGDAVILASPADVTSIVDAMRFVLDPYNKDTLERIRVAGLDRVKAFSWRSCVEFIQKIY